jgi:hypothetical protein
MKGKPTMSNMQPPIGTFQHSAVIGNPDQMHKQSPAAAPAIPTTPAHRNSEAIVRMDGHLVEIGSSLADDVINAGNWKRLEAIVDDANADDERTAATGMNTLLGVAVRCCEVLHAARAKGIINLTGEVSSRADLLYAFSVGRGRFVSLFQATVGTMKRVVEAYPSLRVSKAQDEQQEAKPQQIEIVGMPDRTTSSAVTRDPSGNIVATTQIESDA